MNFDLVMNVVVWLTLYFSWKTDIFRTSHRIRTFYDHNLIRTFTDIRFVYILNDSNKCLNLGLGTGMVRITSFPVQ